MALVLVRAVVQFAQPVKENRPCQGVSRLALIESNVDAAPQFDAANVLEQEQRPFNLAEFAALAAEPGSVALARTAGPAQKLRAGTVQCATATNPKPYSFSVTRGTSEG